MSEIFSSPTPGQQAEVTSTRESGNEAYHEAQGRMALLPNYYRWIVSQFLKHISGTVVELGVGAGLQMEHYFSRADKIIAVDYNPKLLELLKRTYPQEHVVACKVDLRGDWSELSCEANTVLALDVLEHFEDDVAFIKKCHRLLAPGGVLCLKVPAQRALFGPVDEASGHYRRYESDELKQKMLAAGFSVVFQRHMNPVGALGYRMKRHKKSNYSKTFSPTTLRLINTFIPLLSTLDGLPAVKGLSLVGVYRRN
jgi:2-polyprenyl-3-methyl-5-hydroxy-6-metoxy-1,4-benzoquinol methylase